MVGQLFPEVPCPWGWGPVPPGSLGFGVTLQTVPEGGPPGMRRLLSSPSRVTLTAAPSPITPTPYCPDLGGHGHGGRGSSGAPRGGGL